MELPKRKPTRLPYFDYNTPGAYFVTICALEKEKIFGHIVGDGVLDVPQTCLSEIGRIIKKHLINANQVTNVRVEKYVIMPNHIHLILVVDGQKNESLSTPANQAIPKFVSGLKRLCHQSVGKQIFQRSYHDHVIRNQQDYLRIWQYIDNNPALWKKDCFYME